MCSHSTNLWVMSLPSQVNCNLRVQRCCIHTWDQMQSNIPLKSIITEQHLCYFKNDRLGGIKPKRLSAHGGIFKSFHQKLVLKRCNLLWIFCCHQQKKCENWINKQVFKYLIHLPSNTSNITGPKMTLKGHCWHLTFCHLISTTSGVWQHSKHASFFPLLTL